MTQAPAKPAGESSAEATATSTTETATATTTESTTCNASAESATGEKLDPSSLEAENVTLADLATLLLGLHAKVDALAEAFDQMCQDEDERPTVTLDGKTIVRPAQAPRRGL